MKIGSIVTVLDKGQFWKNQGIVADLNPKTGQATIEFGSEVPDYSFNESAPRQAAFATADLREEEWWSTEVMAFRLFGKSMHHSISEPVIPFSARDKCMHEGCPHKAARRAYFNIWGTVCLAYLCDFHTEEYDGSCLDDFPWRKNIKQAA